MLNDNDREFLTRLFGPELPEELLPEAEAAKGVDCEGDEVIDAAIAVVVSEIVHKGLGGGFLLGWRAFKRDGRAVLEVYRFKSEAAEAA